jgi:hypothetical protein
MWHCALTLWGRIGEVIQGFPWYSNCWCAASTRPWKATAADAGHALLVPEIGWSTQSTPRLPKVASSRAPRYGGGTGLGTAFAVAALFLSIEISNAPAALADPPYQDCNQARADGRTSIPFTDPAYQPELDLDGDGLACEPSKSHRSRR